MAGVRYITDGTPVTGSFSKIQILSRNAIATGGSEIPMVKFDDIQFGKGTIANNDGVNNHLSPCHVHSIVANMHVTGSTFIEGPICGFHLVHGEVLAYEH